MRKIVLYIAASLDGFIARKNGGIDWLFSDADYGYKQFYKSIDTVLVGNKTYKQSLGFEEAPFKGKQVFVFAHKPGKPFPGVQFVKNPVELVQKMKKLPGKGIWLCGGSQTISVLLNAGLCDEIILSIHPIILGSGIPLFDVQTEIDLKFVKSKSFPSGLVQLHYLVKK
ncbi:MAG: dihydrofolate reductase family protein [archaeon]|nr:dihydrofolate reductase family protein [archaeon]